MIQRFLCVLLACAALAAGGAAAEPPNRPRDPWVFRCALDERPRMVVLALHESLWVAFDATTCSLYKAWKGDVKFQGAVYDAVHGPQPVVRGTVLLENEDSPWSLFTQSTKIETKPVWKGYRIANNTATLLYDLQTPNGLTVNVEETIDVKDSAADQITLVRTLRMNSQSGELVASLSLPDYRPGGLSMRGNNDLRNIVQDTTTLVIGDESRDITADSVKFRSNGEATLLKALELDPPAFDLERDDREGDAE